MNALCEQIASEKDRHKFSKLVEELNELLEDKQERLDHGRSSSKLNTN